MGRVGALAAAAARAPLALRPVPPLLEILVRLSQSFWDTRALEGQLVGVLVLFGGEPPGFGPTPEGLRRLVGILRDRHALFLDLLDAFEEVLVGALNFSVVLVFLSIFGGILQRNAPQSIANCAVEERYRILGRNNELTSQKCITC